MGHLNFYRLFTYLGLIPFLVFTYQSWCGPIEEVQAYTRAFLIFSSSVLVFIAGGWWGISYTQPKKIRLQMASVGLFFALYSAVLITVSNRPWAIIAIGFAHFLIWILEFFIPKIELSHDYKIQRTVLTMTIVVCHLLVAFQFLPH